jgi:hypothetical protein
MHDGLLVKASWAWAAKAALVGAFEAVAGVRVTVKMVVGGAPAA